MSLSLKQIKPQNLSNSESKSKTNKTKIKLRSLLSQLQLCFSLDNQVKIKLTITQPFSEGMTGQIIAF